MPPNPQRKGAEGERELVRLLEARGIAAHRNLQRYVGGIDNPDVSCQIGGRALHVEVKRRERFDLYPALEQAQRDANGHALPVVAHRRSRKPWVAVLALEDLLNLLEGGDAHGRT